ncbi:MAG: hypothetical protein NT139_00440 [Candidatus Woesearchaeota archaeon]|nr:hypothetical protein [Candidatus Woesearchaeota archaeon]
MPPEERRDIARKGGLAKSGRKTLSCRLNPIKTGRYASIPITKCDECEKKEECPFYKKGSACKIELNIRKNIIRQFKALGGNKPEDMLIEIGNIFTKLEDMVDKKPSFNKLRQLLNILIRIYKMKFGKATFITSANANTSNPTIDIKLFMEIIRKKEKEDIEKAEQEEAQARNNTELYIRKEFQYWS